MAEKLIELFTKRQEWLKQGRDEISVTGPGDKWDPCLQLVPRVPPSGGQGKGKALAGVRPNELRSTGVAAVSHLRSN